jgi:predicted TPR repeat methyltransferase
MAEYLRCTTTNVLSPELQTNATWFMELLETKGRNKKHPKTFFVESHARFCHGQTYIRAVNLKHKLVNSYRQNFVQTKKWP